VVEVERGSIQEVEFDTDNNKMESIFSMMSEGEESTEKDHTQTQTNWLVNMLMNCATTNVEPNFQFLIRVTDVIIRK